MTRRVKSLNDRAPIAVAGKSHWKKYIDRLFSLHAGMEVQRNRKRKFEGRLVIAYLSFPFWV